MKKLKFYLIIALTITMSSTIFTACTSENEALTKQESLSKSNNSNELMSTICSIVGPLNVNNGSYSYTYTSNEAHTNINWVFTPTTAVSIISGNGTNTINVIFHGSCTIKATGTGSGVDGCEETITVTKSSSAIDGDLCFNTPKFTRVYWDYPNPYTGGPIINAFQFENRQVAFDWSTVSSVKIQIGGTFDVGSNSTSVPNINFFGTPNTGNWANTANWTSVSSGFRNIKIWTHTNATNIAPPYLKQNTLYNQPAWATIKFNNGCPDKLLYLNDEEDYSFIE